MVQLPAKPSPCAKSVVVRLAAQRSRTDRGIPSESFNVDRKSVAATC